MELFLCQQVRKSGPMTEAKVTIAQIAVTNNLDFKLGVT